MSDEEDVLELRDADVGDLVAITWPSGGGELAGTTQLVRCFLPCGITKVGKKKIAHAIVCELWSFETMMRVRRAPGQEFNTFVLSGDVEVLGVVLRNPYGRGEDELRAARGDVSDPIAARSMSGLQATT